MSEPKKRARGYPVLLFQLVMANILVAGAVTATLYWIFTGLMDNYFTKLMHEFDISPTKLNSMFASNVEQSLWWGIVVALALGIVLSLLLTKTLLRPISKMVQATEDIAQGDLSARTPALKGELGTLSWHLNDMASALEHQEEGRQQLLRDLSHELRTPLTNVKGYIEGLEDGVFKVGPEVFEVLNAEVRRLNDLIDDLSELSFTEELSGGLQIEAVDPRQEISAVLAAHRARMVENNFYVQVHEQGTPKILLADRKRLNQIFNNAISNMVHYSRVEGPQDGGKRDGMISIDWRQNQRVEICFENRARAISTDDLERLFDRFYRVDKSRSGKSNNVGLGLAIVKRLVNAHGGKVWAEQSGGRFRLFVSLALNNEKVQGAPDAPTLALNGAQGLDTSQKPVAT
jgi:signal transduction histidine kinase